MQSQFIIWRELGCNLSNRYIELVLFYQAELKRDLYFDEIQIVKRIVAKEQLIGKVMGIPALSPLLTTEIIEKS